MATRGLLGHYGGLLQSQTDDRRLRLALEEQRRLREQDRAQMVAQAMQALAGAPAGALQAYAGLQQQEMDNKLRAAQLKNAQAQAESYAKQTETAAARDTREAEAFKLKQMRDADAAAAASHLATLKPELRADMPSYLRNMQSLMREEHGPGPMAPSQATPVPVNLPEEYAGRLMKADVASRSKEAAIRRSNVMSDTDVSEEERKWIAENRRGRAEGRKVALDIASGAAKRFALDSTVAELITKLDNEPLTEENIALFNNEVDLAADNIMRRLAAVEGVSDEEKLSVAEKQLSAELGTRSAGLLKEHLQRNKDKYASMSAQAKLIAAKAKMMEAKNKGKKKPVDWENAYKGQWEKALANGAQVNGALKTLRDVAGDPRTSFGFWDGNMDSIKARAASFGFGGDADGYIRGSKGRTIYAIRQLIRPLNQEGVQKDEFEYLRSALDNDLVGIDRAQFLETLHQTAIMVRDLQEARMRAMSAAKNIPYEEIVAYEREKGTLIDPSEWDWSGASEGLSAGETAAPLPLSPEKQKALESKYPE